MNISLFNKTYWCRHYDEDVVYEGHYIADFTDRKISIHVHPGSDSVKAGPEGLSRNSRIEGHGCEPLISADRQKNRRGDLIYYQDNWYECVSSVCFDHTCLSHYNYIFALVPARESGKLYDLDPPDSNSNT